MRHRRTRRRGAYNRTPKPHRGGRYDPRVGDNLYAYNRTPALGYPAHNTYHSQRGGKWYDMFDPRVRLGQPLWSMKDSLGYGVQSGVHAFMGKYPAVNPNTLVGHFQK